MDVQSGLNAHHQKSSLSADTTVRNVSKSQLQVPGEGAAAAVSAQSEMSDSSQRPRSMSNDRNIEDMKRPRVINVTRGEVGFGFNMIDVSTRDVTGIFISHVTPDGPADTDDGLRPGMQVSHACNVLLLAFVSSFHAFTAGGCGMFTCAGGSFRSFCPLARTALLSPAPRCLPSMART